MVKKRQNEPHEYVDSSDESADIKQKNNLIGGPTKNCIHYKISIDLAKLRKALIDGIKKEGCSKCIDEKSAVSSNDNDVDFEYDKSLWLCLRCGSQLCGRSKNEHALKHFKTPRSDNHALALNTTTYNVWCYECDDELDASIEKIEKCIEFIRNIDQKTNKSTETLKNIDNNITLNDESASKQPSSGSTVSFFKNSISNIQSPISQQIPGMAKRVNQQQSSITNEIDSLPPVRGLSNLGNTCFFNAVMQCLAQTPFLLEILKDSLNGGEEFILPGGTLKINNEDVELQPIKGKLEGLNGLSAALVETLEQLQAGGFVYSPDKLFNKFTSKCPQFKGYDQHDSHECLRQLLESVRCEDLNRYRKVILENLGYYKNKVLSEDEVMKIKCKFYGGQAADRILRPEPVFRGFLVSTLQCQDCYHSSSCQENFLDLSLPINVEKPQPPIRRRNSPEILPQSISSSIISATTTVTFGPPSKEQLKEQKRNERKLKRAAKKHSKRAALTQKNLQQQANITTETAIEAIPDDNETISISAITESLAKKDENNDDDDLSSSSTTSSEQADADVEDNITNFYCYSDQNGNNKLASPLSPEKRGDSPENPNKDSDDDENDSGIATSPANPTIADSDVKGGLTVTTENNEVVELGISKQGANSFILKQQRSLSSQDGNSSSSNGVAGDISSVSFAAPPPPPLPPPLTQQTTSTLTKKLENLSLKQQQQQKLSSEITAAKQKAIVSKRTRTQSYSDWCTTIAPRYQCEEGECSIQSCLNSFTAIELMTGNNKVSCDECTKRMNGDNDENRKKIYTNATKQFLISSPPAVLILHLKRFQVGPRCMFRKLSRPVSFSMVLDIAPFCASKIKNFPNVNRKQKKLLYALYGVVEHSGGMYGGHYTAYVKVRPKVTPEDKRWEFLPKGSKAELDQIDDQLAKLQEIQEKAEAKEKARQLRISENDSDDEKSAEDESSSATNSSADEIPNDNEGAVGGSVSARNTAEDEILPSPPPGKWYYVSDSRVQKADEKDVLGAQAYLLFYERIY